jgi:hypothetical protein
MVKIAGAYAYRFILYIYIYILISQIYKLISYHNKEIFIHNCDLEINTLIERKIYFVDHSGYNDVDLSNISSIFVIRIRFNPNHNPISTSKPNCFLPANTHGIQLGFRNMKMKDHFSNYLIGKRNQNPLF